MATDTKKRIVGAAMRLFAEKGYQATTIAEIARESEANAGSVYFFFQTKQDILLAVWTATARASNRCCCSRPGKVFRIRLTVFSRCLIDTVRSFSRQSVGMDARLGFSRSS